MKRSVFILVFTIFAAFAAPAQVNVGMTDTASYYPLLRGRRVAVLATQTSVAELPGAPGSRISAATSCWHCPTIRRPSLTRHWS